MRKENVKASLNYITDWRNSISFNWFLFQKWQKYKISSTANGCGSQNPQMFKFFLDIDSCFPHCIHLPNDIFVHVSTHCFTSYISNTLLTCCFCHNGRMTHEKKWFESCSAIFKDLVDFKVNILNVKLQATLWCLFFNVKSILFFSL